MSVIKYLETCVVYRYQRLGLVCFLFSLKSRSRGLPTLTGPDVELVQAACSIQLIDQQGAGAGWLTQALSKVLMASSTPPQGGAVSASMCSIPSCSASGGAGLRSRLASTSRKRISPSA